jgi:hypothetical protein
MVSSANACERETIAKDLKEYCGLDTYVMYAIGKHLHELGQRADGETLVPLSKAAKSLKTKSRNRGAE